MTAVDLICSLFVYAWNVIGAASGFGNKPDETIVSPFGDADKWF
jgi:hypothetical protein